MLSKQGETMQQLQDNMFRFNLSAWLLCCRAAFCSSAVISCYCLLLSFMLLLLLLSLLLLLP
jgi:hypothetical protein